MKILNSLILFTLLLLSSCNFESGSEDSSGGGLFTGHKPVENAFLMNAPISKTFIENDNLDFTVIHPYKLTVTGSPRLSLDIGGSTVYADYLTGSGTKTLTFRYTVSSGDDDTDGIQISNTIDLNGGNIQFSNSGNLTSATTTIAVVPNTSGLLVDTTGPTLTAVTPPTPKTYYAGEQLEFIAIYNDSVNVTGTPRLALDIGGSTVYAEYISGSGTLAHIYRYTVQSSDTDLDGITISSPMELNGGSNKDSAGNDASLTFIPIPMLTTFVQGDAPYVTSITLPADNTYILGQVISLSLNFNEAVDVLGGVPSIDLQIGSNTEEATYVSGTGTNTLVFNYIVSQGDEDTNGLVIGNSINLNTASIQDSTFNSARLSISPPLTPNVLVDGSIPTVTALTVPSDANYTTSQNLDFLIEFSETVVVTNTPRLNLSLATGTINANYVTGSGTNTLLFRYTVSAPDIDNDGIEFGSNSIDLNSTGTIVSATYTSLNALLDFTTFIPGDMSNIKINETPGTQLVYTIQPSNTYVNSNIAPSITVEIRDASNNLVVAATDTITLALGTDPSAGSAVLAGTLSVGAVAGIATFSDINIDTLNSGYTLSANATGLTSAVSNPFDIIISPPTQLVITDQPTDSIAGETISPSITVELRDVSNNLVSSATDNVTLSFGTDPSAGNATLGGTLTVAAVGGVATFNDINIDKAFTGYTLLATSGALTQDISDPVTISPATKSQLVFSVDPSNTDYNTNINPTIEVEIQDAFGNKTSDVDIITLAINNNPSGSTLSGTTFAPAIAGTATFSNISLDQQGIGYTLDATATGLTTATSTNFDITATATQLVITQEPTDSYNNFTISPGITVEIRDASNNLVTDATDNVTLAFGTDPSAGAATISGTLTVAAVGGIATFSDISIDDLNNGYTFDFTSGVLTNATSVAFNITQAPPTQLAFIQEPTDAVAGVNITPSITVEIQDASGAVVPTATDNITLMFGTDPSAGSATLAGTVTIAAINGVATFTDINIDKAFSAYTLSASSGVLTAATSATFNISAGAKTQLAFSVEPVNAEYNVNIAPAIEVEIQDAYGNKTSDTDTISVAINNNPSAGTLFGTLSVAAVNGTATFNDINIDNVGDGYTLDVTAAGLTTATSASFDIISIATQLVITQEPVDAYNGFVISPSITVELRDASNNLVADATDNVTLAFGTDPSAGAATIGGTLTVAAIGGIATFSDIDIDTINNGYTFNFTSGALTGATSALFNITQAPATQLAYIQHPTTSVAGVNIAPSITVEIQDANGLKVSTATDYVTLAFGTDASSGAATLGGTLTIAAVAGLATFTDINIDKAFTGYTLNATSGILTNAISNNFDISPAVKYQLAFTVEPINTEYNVDISPSIQVEIQDAFGNKTADTDTITLAINNNPNAGTLSGTLPVAAINGSATFSDINIDNVGIGYTLDATAAGLTTSTSAAFDIIAIPTQIIITQEPSNSYNSFDITPAMTVELRDASNNLVVNATNSVTVAIGTDPSAGAATLGGTLTVAATGGIATFSDINLDSIASGYTLEFTSTGLTSAISTTFDITQAPATQLAFLQEPTSAVAGATLSPNITVEIQDANGNLVTTSTDNVTLAFGTDPSAGASTLGGTVTVAAVAGVATFNDINVDKAFAGYTLSATSGILTTASSASFTISPATKSQLAFYIEPTDAEYGVAINPAIDVEIQDAFGNKTTDTDSITLAINNNPSGGTLAGTLSVAAVNGTATFNDINIDNIGSGYTLDATAGGLTTATSAGFNIIAIPTQVTFVTQPTDAYNDVNIAPAITVELRDASNNLVTNATDSVTLAFGTDASLGSGTLSGTLTVAAIGGVATFNDISIDYVANGYTLIATSGALTIDTSSSFDINQSAPTQLAFVQQPTNTVAGVNITPALTVELRDGNGNIVPTATDNVTIAFATDPSSGTGALGGSLTVAAVSGVATFSDLNIDKAFTGYTFTVTSGALTADTSSAFDINAAAADHLAFSVQPTDTASGASVTPAIEVEIQDIYNNKTSGSDNVTLVINNDPSIGATLGGTVLVGASNGVANFSDINIDLLGVGYTLDATAAGLTTATSDAFEITAGPPTQIIITQEPSNTAAGIAMTPAITVELRDAAGNLSTTATNNVTVAINTDPSAGAVGFSGTKTVAAVGGIATFSDLVLDNTQTGYDFIFTSSGLASATSASFDITAAVPASVAFVQQPSNAIAGSNIAPAITVQILDSIGNLVNTATDNITLAIGTDPSSGSVTLAGSLTVAAVAGVATFSDINLDKAFLGYTLSATSGALTADTSTTFDISAGTKDHLSFSVDPANSGTSVTISPNIGIEIHDAYGNRTGDADNITIAFGTDPSSGAATLGGTLTIAADNGLAEFTNISIDAPGTGYTLNATAAGLTMATSGSFNIYSAPTKLHFTSQPSNTVIGNNIPSFTVAVTDNFNNVVGTETDSITLALQADPSSGGANLAGTLTVSAVSGVATFTGLTLDQAFADYTFTATAAGLTAATSNPFDITLPPPSSITLISPASSPDADTTPTIRVSTVANTDLVKLFTDASCSTEVAAFTATGTSVDITVSTALPEGVSNIYANRTTSSGSISACSSTFLSYEVSGSFYQFDDMATFGNWSNPGGDDGNWSTNSGDTPSIDVGPQTGAGGTGSYAYIEASGTGANDEFFLESNTLDGTTYPLAFTFKWNKRGTNMGNLYVDASNNGGSTWTQIWVHTGMDVATGGAHTWRNQFLDLCNLGYTNNNVQIRLRGEMPGSGDYWNSDMAVDSLEVSSAGCAPAAPATITLDSPLPNVIISYLNESAFVVSGTCSDDGQNVALSGDVSGSTTCSSGTWSKTLDLGAHPDGPILVRADHTSSAGGANGTVQVTYTKDSNTIWNDDFQAGFGNWAHVAYDGSNWILWEDGTPSTNVGPTSGNGGSGKYALVEASSGYPGNGGNNVDYIIESPTIDASGLSMNIEFYWNKRGNNMGDLYFEINENGGGWTTVWSHIGTDVATSGTDTWNQQNIDLCNLGHTSINTQFRMRVVLPASGGDYWNSDVGLDDIKLTNDGCP